MQDSSRIKEHYDKFTPTDAQNKIGTKLMLVHRKLIIAGSTEQLY